jgi:uncharacterized protein (TIGR02145 family)
MKGGKAMKYVICFAAILTFNLSISLASAQDKVVVIPLNSSKYVPGSVNTVTSAGGQVWMDRNLGALRVATKSADPDSYGTLYQWGRAGDGHEYRSSLTSLTQSGSDVPNHGSFITGFTDWRNPANDNLWQGESGINNPCPAGFRLPTEAEWAIERASWISDDAAGALASPLKLPMAGYRFYNSGGTLYNAGSIGNYWSGTVTVGFGYSHYLYFSSGNANIYADGQRALGFSVRCLED